LYLPDAKEQPMNPVKSNDAARNDWRWSACYTYGYNPSLVMHRVHDAMSVLASLQTEASEQPRKIILAGRQQGGVVAAVTAALVKERLAGAVIDTGGFRFASLTDQWDPLFVPGAVKYGDVPALIELCASLNPTVFGENGAQGGTDAVAAAVAGIATKGARPAAKAGGD
jgi:pimeloyl-ACP methyl ester carboxylesterase